MAFIRVQNARRDGDGNIVGGSASIVESEYVSGGARCRQILREGLGRIVFMPDRRSGIFESKTRGLVHYDSSTGEFTDVDRGDPRVAGVASEPRVHTTFGDSFAMMELLKSCGILRILRNMAVGSDRLYEKMVCHTLHGMLRDGSRIGCDRFVESSFLSGVVNLTTGPLRTDSRYHADMGAYEMRVAFFRLFIEDMRARRPGFGRGCYVDSTPLPNSVTDLPMTRLCSHGLASTSTQARLVLVLDIRTGYPVWFEVIPGNVLDVSTINAVRDRVSNLFGVTVEDLVLDAGYVSKDVIGRFNRDSERGTLIARMPAKPGYGMDVIFEETRPLFSNAEYGFVRRDHTFFGIRLERGLFGSREFVYVYVDHENASSHYRAVRSKREGEYEAMTPAEKNRARYEGGFFALVSNIETSPDRMLDDYFGRTEIETAINTGKEYLELLPLNRHHEATVHGKMLQDVIVLIAYMMVRRRVLPTTRSVSDTIYDMRSVMCFRSGDDITVEHVNRQARESMALFGASAPAHISIAEYRRSMLFSV